MDPVSATASGQVKDAICLLASVILDVIQGAQDLPIPNAMNVFSMHLKTKTAVVYVINTGTQPPLVTSGVVLVNKLVIAARVQVSMSALSAVLTRCAQLQDFAHAFLIGMTTVGVRNTRESVILSVKKSNALVLK